MFKKMNLMAAALVLAPLCLSSLSYADQGVALINQVTRKSGGQLYRIYLQEPLSIDRVAITVLSAKAQIHEASLVTPSRARIPLTKLSNTAVIASVATISSEAISRNDNIAEIDVRAESFGAVANIVVSASSPEGLPILSLQQQQQPAPPVVIVNPPPVYIPAPTPAPTPIPTPTPPEIVYLDYPAAGVDPREQVSVSCSARDTGWEEHFFGHANCGECLQKHDNCNETCTGTSVTLYAQGYDYYGRIAMIEGRGGDHYSALNDMMRVCDYYRLSRCNPDPAKAEQTSSQTISRRLCPK